MACVLFSFKDCKILDISEAIVSQKSKFFNDRSAGKTDPLPIIKKIKPNRYFQLSFLKNNATYGVVNLVHFCTENDIMCVQNS